MVGVLIGIVQAATSVQEMTLSFIPKLIILVLLLFFIGNWQIGVRRAFSDFIDEYTNLLAMINILAADIAEYFYSFLVPFARISAFTISGTHIYSRCVQYQIQNNGGGHANFAGHQCC